MRRHTSPAFGRLKLSKLTAAHIQSLYAAKLRDGLKPSKLTIIEHVAKNVTAELAYVVEIERLEAKVGAREAITPIAVRVTTIFRPEDGLWKVVHRHTDPITTPRPAESPIQG